MGNSTVDLLADLKDNNSETRERAATALGKLRDKAAVEPLIEVLVDRDKAVRKAVLLALAEIGDPRAVEPIVDLFEEDDEDIRNYVYMALGPELSVAALPALLKALNDRTRSDHARAAVAWALHEYRQPIVISSLLSVLSKSNIRVRKACVEDRTRQREVRVRNHAKSS